MSSFGNKKIGRIRVSSKKENLISEEELNILDSIPPRDESYNEEWEEHEIKEGRLKEAYDMFIDD